MTVATREWVHREAVDHDPAPLDYLINGKPAPFPYCTVCGQVLGILPPVDRERFRSVVSALDEAVAARPDLLSSPVGFVVGALVSAGNSDADSAWLQLAGLGDLLAYLVTHVRTGEGDPAVIVAALVPDAAP